MSFMMERDSKIHKKNLNNEKIDMISSLPDDLLLKILSSLCYKTLVFTSVLSNRWRGLWKRVTILNCDNCLRCNYSFDLGQFVSNSLRFSNNNNAGVIIKSFHLKVHLSDQVRVFFRPLANSSVDLSEVSIESCCLPQPFPSNFRSWDYWNLKTLILKKLSFEDNDGSYDYMRFRSLKTLHLLSVRFSADKSVQKLLNVCPKLEELVVRRTTYVNVKIFTINVPTLMSLSIDYTWAVSRPVDVHGFVINTPSLRYLSIKDHFSNLLQFENMPKLAKANVAVDCHQSEKFIRSVTSVQHLSLCSKTSKIIYPSGDGTSFFYLEHLELCTCSQEWWKLLNIILKDAPRLKVLKLKLKHCVQCSTDSMDHSWNEPCSVPICLSSHLEIFEWGHYKGTKQETKVAKYILTNASNLKMAIFSSVSVERNRICSELENVARGSEACQLVFK